MTRPVRTLARLLPLLGLLACTGIPVVVSEETLYYRHSIVAGDWRKSGRFTALGAERYVKQIADRLVSASGYEGTVRVEVLDWDVPNAFALIDGSIFITRGLLAVMDSEHELAWVLAHDLAHLAKSHSARQANRNALFGQSDLEASTFPEYSTTFEREADQLAVEWLVAASFDPRCAARIQLAFERIHARSPGGRTMFAAHPAPHDRREFLEARASRRRRRCNQTWALRMAGLPLQSSRQDHFLIDEWSVRLPRVHMQLDVPRADDRAHGRPQFVKQHRRRAGAYPTALGIYPPSLAVYFDYYVMPNGLEWARAEANRIARANATNPPREFQAVGGPGVQVTTELDTRPRSTVISYAWVAGPNYLLELSARVPGVHWRKARPLFRRILESVRELDGATARQTPLAAELHFVRVQDGENLDSIRSRFPEWDVEELSIYNHWDEPTVIRGDIVKVLRRKRLTNLTRIEPIAPKRASRSSR